MSKDYKPDGIDLVHIEASKNHPAEILRYQNGNRAILFPVGRYTYQVDIQHSKGVLNPPPESLEEYINGQKKIESGSPIFVIGATLNGACPADCVNCPFGRSVWKNKNLQAIPVTPVQLKNFLEQSKQIAMNEGVLKAGQKFGVRGFGAGDPSYYTYLTENMLIVSRLENCVNSGWSTIARTSARSERRFNVLRALEDGARQVMQEKPDHKLKMQFSIHDTRPSARAIYTGTPDLIPLEDIAESAQTIREITNRRPNIVFVLKEDTKADGQALINAGLTPDRVVITLRPMDFSKESPTGAPMHPGEMIRIYKNLIKEGYDVAWIPPTPPMDHLPPIELSNLQVYARNQGLLGLT